MMFRQKMVYLVQAPSSKSNRATSLRLPGRCRGGVRVASTAGTVATSTTTTPECRNNPPPLLLKGDQLCVSQQGVSLTLYHLVDTTSSGLALEESYDLQQARKTFLVRPFSSDDSASSQTTRNTLPAILEQPVANISIQEIDHGIGCVGTGATTWDSSLAMALYFYHHPECLRGTMLELGCGLGLGSILSLLLTGPQFLTTTNCRCHPVHSATLTDANQQVLRACHRNVNDLRAKLPKGHLPPLQFQLLDWHDHSDNDPSCGTQSTTYDVVLASDCAYRYQDVAALCGTLTRTLKKEKGGTMHLFGIYNRGALWEVVDYLRNRLHLDVTTEMVDLQRYRLRPESSSLSSHLLQDTDNIVDSKSVQPFLHVTACFKPRDNQPPRSNSIRGGQTNGSMEDID